MRAFNVLRKTMSVVLAFVFLSAQVAYPQVQNTLTPDNTQKLAPGVSAQQSVAAQQNKESMIDTMNALASSQAAPVSTPVNPPVLVHSGAHAMDVLAPDPSTGILTLPNGLQIDLKYHSLPGIPGVKLTIDYYDDGRIKTITNIVGVAIYLVGKNGSMYNTTSKVYSFADEAYYNTTLGSMGRMTGEKIVDTINSGSLHPETTYKYWGDTDKVRTKSTVMVSQTTGAHQSDFTEYDANGAVIQNTHYEFGVNGPAGSSGLSLSSRTLSVPDAQGYVYYEYSTDDVSRDQWNNSIGHVTKAVKADGSYDTFDSYYQDSTQAKTVSSYSSRGQLNSVRTYDASGNVTKTTNMLYNVLDLQRISQDLSADYVLCGNIDASDTRNWNDGAGFDPLGTSSLAFTGIFDGNGYSISNLFINRAAESNVGLFGFISGAELDNVHLVNATITGLDDVGGLVGRAFLNNIIQDANINAVVTGRYSVGVLAGSAVGQSSVSNSSTSGTVTGIDNAGGLVGWFGQYGVTNVPAGDIDSSSSSASVIAGMYVGGLVGMLDQGTITDSSASGYVEGTQKIGGLVGYNDSGAILWSHATGNVKNRSYDHNTGGLVGLNAGLIQYCYATGGVTGGYSTGGLAGANFSTILNSYATGDIDGRCEGGGLVGANYGWIKNSYATGDVAGLYNRTGGLVGIGMSGGIENCYSTGKAAGGLSFWSSFGEVINSFWNTETSGTTWSAGGTGKTTAQMMDQNTFTGWDFSVVGDGTIGNWIMAGMPHLQMEHTTTISDAVDLQLMAVDLGAHYTLANNIDASATSSWNGGQGFDPIGKSEFWGGGTPFSGVLNGNGNVISNLYINRQNQFGYVRNGLFGTARGSTIRDVRLTGENVYGHVYTGGLVGYNSGSIINCSVDANIYGDHWIGDLVGYNNGTISGSHAAGSVITGAGFQGGFEIGGLVGTNDGAVTGSYSNATVSGGDSVGGLIGINRGSVSSSYATGNVNGHGSVGGLIGWNNGGSISSSYATGAVGSSGYAGGLIGQNNLGSITNSYATGNVNGTTSAGGLIGYNNGGTVSSSNATGSVVNGGDNAGGLIGQNIAGSITDSYATGTVRGNNAVGGLVGNNNTNGTISRSYSTGGIWGIGTIGGLVGYNDGGIIEASHATGSVVNTGYNTGGLVGWNKNGSIADSYATGAVSGYNTVGGLVGYNDQVGIIRAITGSYSTGNVSGNDTVGGLVGWNDLGYIRDSSASGIVTANTNAGGLVAANNYGIDGIINSYATHLYNVLDLQLMKYKLNGTFTMMNNIDASATSSWNGGRGFDPIGSYSGIFDGAGYKIDGLYIDQSGSIDQQGLFRSIDAAGVVKNVSLTNVSVFGRDYIGTLAAFNFGLVENCSATGSIPGTECGGTHGGLVAVNYGIISNSFANVNVTGNHIGGLVGQNRGTISNCYATGTVNGMGTAGGLAYGNWGLIEGSYATGTVSAAGGFDGTSPVIGGLVGYNNASGITGITNSYATHIYNVLDLQLMKYKLNGTFTMMKNIDASDTKNWNGGLGFASVGNLTTAFTGTLNGQNYNISGLTINRPTQDYVGLFGYTKGTINNVIMVGGSIIGNMYVGGLAGRNDGIINFATNSGNVTGREFVGGLVGYNIGHIHQCKATGIVRGTRGRDRVGQLVGLNRGTID